MIELLTRPVWQKISKDVFNIKPRKVKAGKELEDHEVQHAPPLLTFFTEQKEQGKHYAKNHTFQLSSFMHYVVCN